MDRGRTLKRTASSSSPLARAESIPGRPEVTIEIDSRTILKRPRRSSTFHDDPTSSPALLDDNLLEPCPDSCTNVSEVLDGEARPQSSASRRDSLEIGQLRSDSIVSITENPGVSSPRKALTTVYNDCRPLYPAPIFPPETLAHLAADISHLEFMALKSSGSRWSSRINSVAGSLHAQSLAASLPVEIIQQIYSHLSPTDFNSARHTCRSWFVASLEHSIMETMLKRGGWYAGSQYDLTANHVLNSRLAVNDEWLMSKRISRECALGPDWKGNGFSESGDAIKSAFVQESRIDFSEVSVHHPGVETVGSIFIVSSCGKFLMVANGCLIYLYELNKSREGKSGPSENVSGSLRPVTSIICPRRVLACSMDTSSHRYAVAILLDGRMGLVCDISIDNIRPSTQESKSGQSMSTSSPIQESVILRLDAHSTFLDHVQGSSQASTTQPPFVSPVIANKGARYYGYESDIRNLRDIMRDHVRSNATDLDTYSTTVNRTEAVAHDGRLRSILPANQGTLAGDNTMLIESGLRSLYRNICSDDDPPRSVAICPQRRCVAFGCSAGIELHWVDALTGQDLNRWFPLTAPSDFLFFLPPRKTIDSAKKLRLISSAARPSERAAAIERAFGARTRSSPFWERVDLESQEAEGSIGMLSRLRSEAKQLGSFRDISDHYRAVPLSDGYHILFTDPATNLLCLGSDAPVGGPTKLLRKIWFHNPEGRGKPIIYAGGSDLTWGVRVVAAFGSGEEQSIWLFSVPADVFICNQDMHISSTSFFLSDRMRVSTNTKWMDWWPDDGLYEWSSRLHDPLPGLYPRRVWPLQIRGQEIGTCRGVVDLAVDSGPLMTIWAFSKTGVAKVWRINDGRGNALKTSVVARDGTIRKVDTEGDLEMTDSASSSPDILHPPFPLGHLDGADWSTETVATCSRFGRRDRTSWSASSITLDADGDVVMDNAANTSLSEKQRNAMFWAKYGWSEASYRGQIATVREEVVEDLAGIARIDLEIR